jgi:hypothetical protein
VKGDFSGKNRKIWIKPIVEKSQPISTAKASIISHFMNFLVKLAILATDHAIRTGCANDQEMH